MGQHLEATLDAQTADLLHEQKYAVATGHDVVVQLAQLHAREILHSPPPPDTVTRPDRHCPITCAHAYTAVSGLRIVPSVSSMINHIRDGRLQVPPFRMCETDAT